MKSAFDQQKIGQLILNLRQKKKLSQQKLATLLHTSQPAIARMEKGMQNFSTKLLKKIGKVFGREMVVMAPETVSFKIQGGKKLSGSIEIKTAKNSAIALMCASLLNTGETVLKEVPKIEEVYRMAEVLQSLGMKVVWKGQNLHISGAKDIQPEKINKESAEKTRSILLLLAPLSHLFKNFNLPLSGGCKLGARTVRPHLFALQEFGININTIHDYYEIHAAKLKPAEIVLYETGDTVTENALLAAAKISGKSIIRLASSNYMVQDLCRFLTGLGVKIEGIGTSTLTVYGKTQINKHMAFHLSEDPIEAMMFLSIAATTNSSIAIKRCPIDFLQLELLKLAKMGMRYNVSARYKSKNGFTSLVDIQTLPSKLTALEEKIHPLPSNAGINIDNLPFFVPIASQAQGDTLIHDWVYENRAVYYLELNKLRADIKFADPHRVFISGPTELKGAEVVCPPALRPAAIILIAMLAAKGESVLRNVYSINRGYEDLAVRLKSLGAKIEILHGA